MNLKNQNGSVTLFILAVCLFFLASVACLSIHLQSLKVSTDREYRQIKANYEKDLSEENMNLLYAELSTKNNLGIVFSNTNHNKTQKEITVNVSIENLDHADKKTLKYGWYHSDVDKSIDSLNSSYITKWAYVEPQNGQNEFVAIRNYPEDVGYYYLCVMIDNTPHWMSEKIDLSE